MGPTSRGWRSKVQSESALHAPQNPGSFSSCAVAWLGSTPTLDIAAWPWHMGSHHNDAQVWLGQNLSEWHCNPGAKSQQPELQAEPNQPRRKGATSARTYSGFLAFSFPPLFNVSQSPKCPFMTPEWSHDSPFGKCCIRRLAAFLQVFSILHRGVMKEWLHGWRR